MQAQATNRNKELARIHCLKRDAGLDDAAYRDMLWTQARVRSAKDLDTEGRSKIIRALSGRVRGFPGRPHNVDAKNRRELKKVEAYLADAGRPWKYAHEMARKICGKQRIEFCGQGELYKIVSALELDARRRLIPLLEAECEKWGWPWEALESVARREFDYCTAEGFNKNIRTNAQIMSLVLRWFAGKATGTGKLQPPQEIA